MKPYLLHHLIGLSGAPGANFSIIEGESTYSIDDLSNAAAHLATNLIESGVTRGDRVAICLPKSFYECAAILAVSLAGGVFVPINPLLRKEQVEHIISDCEAAAIITIDASLKTVPNVLLEGDGALPICRVDTLLETSKGAQPVALTDQSIGEDLAAILYTSGSTGRPKGVMLSHRNLIAGARIVSEYLHITPADRILSLLPFSFDYGLNQYTTALHQGASLVLGSFRFGNDIVKLLEKHQITGLAGVPTIWAILTNAAPRLKTTRLKKLRYITNSGGAVPEATVGKLQDLLPDTDIYLMYGLTEAFRSSFLPPSELKNRPTSMGKAIPECELFALKADGTKAKPGEEGILVHRGPTVSLGYWKRPEETAKVIRPNPLMRENTGADLVCWSGDLVTQDDEGYFYFVGRSDAMIKSAGYRISPTEVEEVLMATGYFTHVAVIGLPDEWVGKKVHAVAVLKSPDTDASDALVAAKGKLPAYMVPKEIELVDSLPVTANGKVDYKGLVKDRS